MASSSDGSTPDRHHRHGEQRHAPETDDPPTALAVEQAAQPAAIPAADSAAVGITIAVIVRLKVTGGRAGTSGHRPLGPNAEQLLVPGWAGALLVALLDWRGSHR